LARLCYAPAHAELRVWERIREAFEKEEIVTGTITRRIKGGVDGYTAKPSYYSR
jgi:ribosomal protein S1